MISLNIAISGTLFGGTAVIWIMAYFAIKRRAVPGAKSFATLCLATSFYTLGYGMEIISADLIQVDFWSKFQYIGLPFIPMLWVLVAIDFCKKKVAHWQIFYGLLLIMPMLTSIFRFTSEWFHLQYEAMQMVSNGYFQVLSIERGPWYYIHYIYLIVCSIYSINAYWQVRSRARGYLKKQTTLLVIASITPVIAVVLNTFFVFPLKLDGGPFFVFANYSLFLVGIFRYNLLHLGPLARQRLFDWIQDGVIVFDMQLDVVDFNRVAGELFPEMTRDLIGKNLKIVFSNYDEFMTMVTAWHCQLTNKSGCESGLVVQTGNFDLVVKDDQLLKERYFFCRFSELYERQELVGFSVLMSDVTEHTETMKKLEIAAQTDGLTGLMNRGYFIEQMENRVQEASCLNCTMALIIFDIDHFKEINDRFGHLVGDEVLRVLSRRAQSGIREGDLLGRYGGEEFIVFLPYTDQQGAMAIANHLKDLFVDELVICEDVEVRFSASFGITTAICSEAGSLQFDELVKKADLALYQAKNEGRNRVVCN